MAKIIMRMKKMVVSKNQSQIQDLISFFFENNSVKELKIKLSKPLVLTQEEFKEIIGAYDSSNGVIDNNVYLDEYVYDQYVYDEQGNEKKILAKLNIEYKKDEEGNVYIKEIQMWKEVLSQ